MAAGPVSAVAVLTDAVIRLMMLKKLALSAAILSGAVLLAWTATAPGRPRSRETTCRMPQQPGHATVQAIPAALHFSAPVPLDDPKKSALHGRIIDPAESGGGHMDLGQ